MASHPSTLNLLKLSYGPSALCWTLDKPFLINISVLRRLFMNPLRSEVMSCPPVIELLDLWPALKIESEVISSPLNPCAILDGKAAPVALLDWYDIGREVLLVMERPVPCEDLFHYIDSKGGTLQEEAKIIVKQLIHTAIDLEDNNIFHQHIKTDNILIQTHSNTPQARLIDFGVSCTAEKDSILRGFSGTPINAPPEAFKGFGSPGSTTVWQLGVVLYETLHYRSDFSTIDFLEGNQMIDNELSDECQDFFQVCLNTSDEQCPYLQDLLHHPWLRGI